MSWHSNCSICAHPNSEHETTLRNCGTCHKRISTYTCEVESCQCVRQNTGCQCSQSYQSPQPAQPQSPSLYYTDQNRHWYSYTGNEQLHRRTNLYRYDDHSNTYYYYTKL